MLHFLFCEYKFFQLYYPARRLTMTDYHFGSLIQQQLVDCIPLGIAIRYSLNAWTCLLDANFSDLAFRLSRSLNLTFPHTSCIAWLDLMASIHRNIADAADGGRNTDLHDLSIGCAANPVCAKGGDARSI